MDLKVLQLRGEVLSAGSFKVSKLDRKRVSRYLLVGGAGSRARRLR